MDSVKNETVQYVIGMNEMVQYLNGTVNDTLLQYFHRIFVVNSHV